MKVLIRAGDNGNIGINFEPVFERLNEELSAKSISLNLVCAGGYVMQLHGHRGTADIDAFFRSNAEIDRIIEKVGDEFEINRPDELWLNNSISNMNPTPPAEHRELAYKFSNLTVEIVTITYLLGMKLHSGRDQDLKDAADIIRKDGVQEPFELMEELENIGFTVDISNLLDTFGEAHGIDWLTNFYEENQNKLQEYF